MHPENLVCKFEQAKDLKDIGIFQSAVFRFTTTGTIQVYGNPLAVSKTVHPISTERGFKDYFAAFTASELGLMIAGTFAETTVWDALSHSFTLPNGNQSLMYDTEAECRAAQVLHMIRTGMVSVEECNTRLMADW